MTALGVRCGLAWSDRIGAHTCDLEGAHDGRHRCGCGTERVTTPTLTWTGRAWREDPR